LVVGQSPHPFLFFSQLPGIVRAEDGHAFVVSDPHVRQFVAIAEFYPRKVSAVASDDDPFLIHFHVLPPPYFSHHASKKLQLFLWMLLCVFVVWNDFGCLHIIFG